MSQPATLTWFARHELSLFWRDWISMMTAGKRRREPLIAVVIVGFIAVIHLIAYFIVGPFAADGLGPDKTTLVVLSGSIFLSWTLMLSQAMESVTRAFYARADLDLILSSPASARRLFAVRMAAIAISTTLLTTALAGPFINALMIYDGPRWLAGYGVLAAMGAVATALAVVLTAGLFRALGPRRTRLVAQIVSAVVGAAFVIGVQAAAILSTGSFSRFAFLSSDAFVAWAPGTASPLWWPARAAMGEPLACAAVLLLGLAALALVIALFSASFGDSVLAAASASYEGRKRQRRRQGFRPASIRSALRRKEWVLLRRDPWLVSQSLMQVLYLLPPALILWRYFGDNAGALLIMVPVLVMATGQLAGGLAWLAVSGEDAPDLVASAPVSARAVITAKIEAVLIIVLAIALPLLAALALAAPRLAAVAAIFIAVAAGSGTLVQIWFRSQAKRSHFRHRQTSSRVATLAEALGSVLWAGTAALAAAGSWFAAGTGAGALLTLFCAWLIRPRQAGV